MPHESMGVMEPEHEEEVTHFSRSKAAETVNQVSVQIKAYAAHVAEVAARTGKTSKEVVEEEKDEIKKSGGIASFLKNR